MNKECNTPKTKRIEEVYGMLADVRDQATSWKEFFRYLGYFCELIEDRELFEEVHNFVSEVVPITDDGTYKTFIKEFSAAIEIAETELTKTISTTR